MRSESSPGPGLSKIPLLFGLYFVQGLPFGFQATALPAILRSQGMSLAGIGLLGALSLPWILKVVWAPLVDHLGSPVVGRRKSWIIPLQVALILASLVTALVTPDEALTAVLVLILVMNLFAATMDIAVDGLAVDILRPWELGYGNAVQVVGYKVGMLTGGGLLLWASRYLGWRGIFLGMAALTTLVLLATLPLREGRSPGGPERAATLRAIVIRLFRALRAPGSLWLLLLVATYKMGESMVDAMFRPFLVDLGIPLQTIGLWLGTYGMLFSLAGSLLGGVLASRIPIWSALAATAALRVFPLLAQWALAAGFLPTGPAQIVAVICAEGFLGGALTTATFAFMMSRVDRGIGATHFTALASIEVLGKILAAMLSGILAQLMGYSALFGTGVALSVAVLFLLPKLRTQSGSSAAP